MAEAVACYRQFISGLLDVTDNIVNGVVVPPDRVRRYDRDDPYLVVAADKGTATFSDHANDVSAQYGFWLGDAFASGGSNGYDHKKMGITARGAWISVQRHFNERGVDADSTDYGTGHWRHVGRRVRQRSAAVANDGWWRRSITSTSSST
jgi:glutamate dehydrogenase